RSHFDVAGQAALRVASARVYSIVKSRDVQHFETALRFLEATFRLLPRLVAAIKHMKIMFGLKTMVRKYEEFVYSKNI
uniref:TERF1-interacting nuclear factor 2 N-terminal domain-containing protein n=1 Tax=Amphiprion percula TaxID=161767 RepID=A0A3P8S996_AMPPE